MLNAAGNRDTGILTAEYLTASDIICSPPLTLSWDCCLTLPSVTVCSVLMSETLVSLSGVESRKLIAWRTKAWMTCVP